MESPVSLPGSGSVFPPRSGPRSLGGIAEVVGLENWGPGSHPQHEGSPCLGHDAVTTGQMSSLTATGSAQLAGSALLESVASDSWAWPGGPGGPTAPGFLQLLRVPRCGCGKALGLRPQPGGDWGGGPAGQRQPGSPSAWPRMAGRSPADPRVPLPFPFPRRGRRAAGC